MGGVGVERSGLIKCDKVMDGFMVVVNRPSFVLRPYASKVARFLPHLFLLNLWLRFCPILLHHVGQEEDSKGRDKDGQVPCVLRVREDEEGDR